MTGILDAFLLDCVGNGDFPGASYAFGTKYKSWAGCVGRLGYGGLWPEVTAETQYDIASLTKVVATTPVAHRLWSDGALHLDARVTDVLPEFRHADVTVEHLLRHESGLPAYADLVGKCRSRDEVWTALLALDLDQDPGKAMVYSCVGFIVLQRLLERVTNRPLSGLVSEFVHGPLRLTATVFSPMTTYPLTVAPTGRLEPWHEMGQGWLQGRVHDPLASLQGGVSGNAGLFSTAADLAKYGRAFVRDDGPWSPGAWVSWIERKNGHLRALGWDLKSESGSSAGQSMSGASFGHTGFTGTSLWIDPEAGFYAVLLTNAIHPLGARKDIRSVRSSFADLAMTLAQAN